MTRGRISSILVVIERRTTTRLVGDLLHRIGAPEFDVARSGTHALDMMRDKKYGLVIADWDLKAMSGLQFLKAVRADEKLRRTRFLMAAADLSAENVILARKAGADAYILEPFDAAALQAKITEVARRA